MAKELCIHELDVNTGERRTVPISMAGPEFVARVYSQIMSGDMAFPRGFHVTRIDIGPGRGSFEISKKGRLVSISHLCWSAREAFQGWEHADEVLFRPCNQSPGPEQGWNVPRMPKLPWLASLLVEGGPKLTKKDLEFLQCTLSMLALAILFPLGGWEPV